MKFRSLFLILMISFISKLICMDPEREPRPYLMDKNPEDDYSAIEIATMRSDYGKLAELLSLGEDINQQGECGITPLLWAIKCTDLKMCEFLLESGAIKSLEIAEYSGSYPIHSVLYSGNLEIMELLLKYGANPNSLNGSGMTPLQQMLQSNLLQGEVKDKMRDLLVNHGAR